jgi:hypothetical protein
MAAGNMQFAASMPRPRKRFLVENGGTPTSRSCVRGDYVLSVARLEPPLDADWQRHGSAHPATAAA